ncbi:hypothetical protein TNCV_2802541 [Trichonephila clavipes]|nr:hypothetical protein TNCV_2802541 [Trichonephila clavipes]
MDEGLQRQISPLAITVATTQIDVLQYTTQRKLLVMGLCSWRPIRVPLLCHDIANSAFRGPWNTGIYPQKNRRKLPGPTDPVFGSTLLDECEYTVF